MPGRVVVENNTGRAIHVFGCGTLFQGGARQQHVPASHCLAGLPAGHEVTLIGAGQHLTVHDPGGRVQLSGDGRSALQPVPSRPAQGTVRLACPMGSHG
jgi:hypothetical protein